MGGMNGNTINKKIKTNGGEMSKIDVLIIVHNEHEGLLSVGNSEHAHYGCARVGYWGTGKSGYLAKRNTRIYSRFINTFNPNFPKKNCTGKLLVLL